MANENNEICDIVKKCKILLLDIEGTTTSISFVKDKLFPYAEENVKEFLANNWDNNNVKEAVAALRKLAVTDQENSVDGVVTIPGEDADKEGQIEGLVKSVKWQMSSDRKVGALKQLQGLIWKQGYDKGDIKGHLYEDVSPAIDQWRSVEGQKVYIYSSGSVQAQKLLFGQSVAGDLLPLIEGHFDTTVGPKQEAASYTAIAEKIGCKPEEILFLTDILKEGEAARASGLHVALVSREGNAPLPPEATASYPMLHSFTQLTVSNKRKPDPQDELPAKVLKTDIEDDVKTATEVETSETTAVKNTEEPEKMEVDEDVANKTNTNVPKKSEEDVQVETVVEEITDSNQVADTTVRDGKPVIIEESGDKTEQKQTVTMDTDSTENVESSTEPKEKFEINSGEEKAPVAENSPITVITEIEEITNEKTSLGEMADMIEDLEPVVEEPVEDMDDLQNVGEVLEKECDEILSKVQDVTNLSNIPLKPLLNTIAEETMETDNIDSNDIVDRILDTEIELGMKPCEDIDLNSVKEISDAKTEEATEAKIDSEKVSTEETIVTSEEKPVDEPAEEIMETKSEDSKVESENTKTEEVAKVETPVSEDEVVVSKEESAVSKDETGISKVEESKVKAEEKIASEINKVKTEDKVAPESNKVKPEGIKLVPEEKKVTQEENKEKSDESKADTVENKKEAEENKVEPEENKVAPEKSEAKPEETKVELAESKVVTNDGKVEAEKTQVESKELLAEQSSSEKEIPAETKEKDSAPEEVEMDSDVTEAQVNGKSTNGEAEAMNLNGDASKDEELSSRLSVENGKEEVNGSNSDSTDAKKIQGDNKMETEVSDIKVKTVASDEPRSDPIEQPTEA